MICHEALSLQPWYWWCTSFGLDNGLDLSKTETIIWTTNHPVPWCLDLPLRHNGLTIHEAVQLCHNQTNCGVCIVRILECFYQTGLSTCNIYIIGNVGGLCMWDKWISQFSGASKHSLFYALSRNCKQEMLDFIFTKKVMQSAKLL